MEEAFAGPMMPAGQAGQTPLMPGQKVPKEKRKRSKDGMVVENFAPAALSGSHGDPDRQTTPLHPQTAEILRGPSADEQRPVGGGSAMRQLESGVQLQDFFPLPGESADTEEWAKAFTLEPSANPGIPVPRFSPVSVQGKSNLWRQIPVPPAPSPMPAETSVTDRLAAVPTDIGHRLDVLTRQLDSLTGAGPSAMQSTAELFLFVAIGLLLLLAIDTLLRFAASFAQRGARGGARGRGFRSGGGGRRGGFAFF